MFRVASGILRSAGARGAARAGDRCGSRSSASPGRRPRRRWRWRSSRSASASVGSPSSYRATLLRGAADQAADRVPLDGLIAPGPDFTRPLDVARARALARARRRDASGPCGARTRRYVARRLERHRARARRPGGGAAADPRLARERRVGAARDARAAARAGGAAANARAVRAGGRCGSLTVAVDSPAVAVDLTAVLREPDRRGAARLPRTVRRARERTLRARLPPGRWELSDSSCARAAGLEATNGHQNAENPAQRARRFTATRRDSARSTSRGARIGCVARRRGSPRSGPPGTRRRRHPLCHDVASPGSCGPPSRATRRPVPVLVGRGGCPHGRRLALTIDGEPVSARVVGVAAPVPDASAAAAVSSSPTRRRSRPRSTRRPPDEGASDELWQLGGRPRPRPFAGLTLRLAGGRRARLAQRADRAGDSRHDDRGGGAGGCAGARRTARSRCSGACATAGSSSTSSPRDSRRVRCGAELRLRIALAAALGVLAGLGDRGRADRLAVAAVRAGLGAGVPQPPLVTVAPWAELAGLAAAALVACAAGERGRHRVLAESAR